MNQRDLELLSSYLDGQLSPSDSTRLEARLKTDPELASVLTDLRAARTLLRKLPARKAPRNFTLTRKMVGQNPPLPRAYPIFRFATALATLLFVFSFGLNTVGRQMASQAAYGIGGGGGCDPTTPTCPEAQSFAAEVPAAAPIAAATEAPAETEAPPLVSMAPVATQMPTEVSEAARTVETPASKSAADTANVVNPDQPQVQNEAPSPVPLIPSIWQTVLAVIAIGGGLFMVLVRQISARRWK
jgi:anti-sigma factor RsiW